MSPPLIARAYPSPPSFASREGRSNLAALGEEGKTTPPESAKAKKPAVVTPLEGQPFRALELKDGLENYGLGKSPFDTCIF
jgi:hypothetical protein